MWNFERIKEWIAWITDWFSLKYSSWDFLVKTKKDDEKEVFRFFYKQNFLEESVFLIGDTGKLPIFLLYINSISIFDIFKEIWVLFIPKKMFSNGVVSWFSCYDENMKRIIDTDWVYWDFNYHNWKIYFHEVFNNNIRNLWKQFVINRDWKKETWEKIKIFSDWSLYQELNDIKDINKECLYSINIGKWQSRVRKYYSWAFFILLKEIFNTTKNFFWEEYTIKLKKCIEPLEKFCNNYSIVITNEIKIGIEWEKNISKEKYIEFQKLILTNFPQLLAVKYENNEDISDNYCSFFLRIENDGKISNLQQIQHLFHTFEHFRPLNYASSRGITIIYPTFPVSLQDEIDNEWETNNKKYEINFTTGMIDEWDLSSLKTNDIFFSFLNDESSYLRKFLEEKDSKGNKNHYKIIFFVWIESLEKKYWKWIYILEIKNSENLRFLREDWTIIFSIDDLSFKEVFPSRYHIKLNERTWNCFFVDYYWKEYKNFICLNLLNYKIKLIKDSNFETAEVYNSEYSYCIEQYLHKKGKKVYCKQPVNFIDTDFTRFKGEYIIWYQKDDDYYFKRNGVKGLNYVIKKAKEYILYCQERGNIYMGEDDILYWDLNWNWFLSLLYALKYEIWVLNTTFNKQLFVNDNLKVWFFIS